MWATWSSETHTWVAAGPAAPPLHGDTPLTLDTPCTYQGTPATQDSRPRPCRPKLPTAKWSMGEGQWLQPLKGKGAFSHPPTSVKVDLNISPRATAQELSPFHGAQLYLSQKQEP